MPRAEVIDEDLTEDQQQNHHVMEAVDSSCVGQVEVEVPAANVDSGDRTDSITEAKGQTKHCVCNEQGRAEINTTLLDKIVKVCCVLVNMCPSVVVKPAPNETCSC